MTIASILALLEGDEDSAAVIEAAFSIARQHDSTLKSCTSNRIPGKAFPSLPMA